MESTVFSNRDTLILGLLLGILAVLLAVLLTIIWPSLSGIYRRFMQKRKKQIARRRKTIQAWVITKPIRDHSICEVHEQHAIEPTDGTDEEESKEMQECLICLEPFCIGDTVSYSSTKDCHHAFHSPCIEGWLLSHIDCPTCRRMFLLVDYTRQKIPEDTLKELVKKRKRRYQSTYFCIQHGVVTLDAEHQRKTLQPESMISSVSELEDMIADAEPLTATGTNKEGMPSISALVLPFRNAPESSTVSMSLDGELNGRDSISGDQVQGDDEYRVIRSNGSTETTSTELSTSSYPSL